MAKRSTPKKSQVERDYEVGYAKPPRGRPFMPGQSGNPSGRRKAEKSVIELTNKELARPRRVTRDGKTITYKYSEVAARQLAKKIAKGDLAALRLVEQWLPKSAALPLEPAELQIQDPDAPLTEAEWAAFRLAGKYLAYSLYQIDGVEIWPDRAGA